jgi:hypothetical protein
MNSNKLLSYCDVRWALNGKATRKPCRGRKGEEDGLEIVQIRPEMEEIGGKQGAGDNRRWIEVDGEW